MVVGDPALVVRLAGGLGAGEGIGGVDGLLDGLLGGARLLGLGEQGLDPGLVDEEEGASEGGSEDEVEEDDLGIEEAGGSLDNGGAALVRRHLEDDALCIGEDGEQMQAHILRVHVEHKRVRKRLCLAGLNLQAVLHDGQVAHDALVGGHVVGELLGRPQRAVGEEELDGPVLVVGDLDEGRRGAAIDQLEAEDVGVGERGSNVGVEGGGLGYSLGNRLLLSNCAKDLQGQKSEERRLEQHDGQTTKDANQKLGSAN